MAQNINQFAQSPQKGMPDLKFNASIVSVQIDSSEVGLLVPGQCVKMVDSADGVPKVVACSAITDDVFGVLLYNIKNKTYKALDYAEIVAMRNSVIYMEAGAAIARNAKVMLQVAGSKVVTAAGVGSVVLGRAYDKASGDGSLIRVVVDLPGAVL
jgi:hypothetical protein